MSAAPGDGAASASAAPAPASSSSSPAAAAPAAATASVSALYFSAVRAVRASVPFLHVRAGGPVGDRKFDATDAAGARELLGVDAQFTGPPGAPRHGENVVFAGLDLHALPEGTVLRVCPAHSGAGHNSGVAQVRCAAEAAKTVCPGAHAASAECLDQAHAFARALATDVFRRRRCISLEVLAKRNCKGSSEEAQGRRGVFLRSLPRDPEAAGVTIGVGDSVEVQRP